MKILRKLFITTSKPAGASSADIYYNAPAANAECLLICGHNYFVLLFE